MTYQVPSTVRVRPPALPALDRNTLLSPAQPDVAGFPVDGLIVEVVTTTDRAKLTVHGEVDLATAPTLGALMAAVLDQDHRHVTFNAADVGFMDAAGLRVIVAALNRLDAIGGQLVISAPSAAVTRVLSVIGLDARVSVDAEQVPDRDPASSPGQAGRPAATSLTDMLSQVAAIPANRSVVDAALSLVVRLAGGTINGADGISVTLRRQGRLATVAASDETVIGLDHRQYDTGQGPCVAAAREGRQFHVDAVPTEQRWPAFMPAAAEQGITSMLSTPLTGHDGPVGSINLYGRHDRVFDAHDREVATSFAATVSTIVAMDALELSDDDITARLQQALVARETIAHAQGVLIGREAINAEDAYSQLRRHSQTTSQSIVDFARQIVDAATHGGDDV
jgi:anti-anti-sigma factor